MQYRLYLYTGHKPYWLLYGVKCLLLFSTAFASLTSSLYLDVSLGITDAGVFNAPANCVQVPDAEEEGNYIEVEVGLQLCVLLPT